MKKNAAKYKILNYMLNRGNVFKLELAQELNLSMPTVLSNINELMATGLIVEVGESRNTGGRKAYAVGIQKNYRYSLGVDITANHIGIVLVNLGGEVIAQERVREKFEPNTAYLIRLSERVKDFCARQQMKEKLLGIGISLPGIVNEKERILVKSHTLKLENYSLKTMEQLMPLPVHFENDANAAMLAEHPSAIKNIVYFFLL